MLPVVVLLALMIMVVVMMMTTPSVATPVITVPGWGRVGFELFVLIGDTFHQILAKLFRVLYLFRVRAGDMEVHGFVAFSIGSVFHKPRATTFDLNPTTSFLLNMLYICSLMAYDRGTEVKARDRFEIYRNSFFRPFSPTELVPFDLLNGLPSPKPTLVNQRSKFLLHKLFDLGDGFVQAFLGSACDV